MDPLSHAALGRTLIAFDPYRRLGHGTSAACILGALSPDLDLALALQGWDVYLRAHQGGTHALAGAIVCGALTATAVRLLTRGSRWLPLFAAATAGAISHVALDLLAGADIRPLRPLADIDVTLPLFAMADPWLVALFVIALALLWRARRPRIAAAVVLALLGVSAAKGSLYARAGAIARQAVPGADRTRADAVFGSWAHWTFFHTVGGAAERWDVDALGGRARRLFRVDRGVDVPAVAASRSVPTVSNLLASHDITVARVRVGSGGGDEVLWSDLRYCSASLAASHPVCGLWFGAEYQAGQLAGAIVYVGSFVQRRAATPADHQ